MSVGRGEKREILLGPLLPQGWEASFVPAATQTPSIPHVLSFPKASPRASWEKPGLLLGVPDVWESKTMRAKFRAAITGPYRVPGTSRICHLQIIWDLELLTGGKHPHPGQASHLSYCTGPYMSHLHALDVAASKLSVVSPYMAPQEALGLSAKGTLLHLSCLLTGSRKEYSLDCF